MKKFLKLCSLFLLVIFAFSIIFPCVSNVSNASNAIIEAYSKTPESELDPIIITNIILISVGVVLILLGIAIFIRLKNL